MSDANYLKIYTQSKNSAYSQQSGLFSHIVLTDSNLTFISSMVLNFIKKKSYYRSTGQTAV